MRSEGGSDRIHLRGLSPNQRFTMVPNEFVRDNADSVLKSLDRLILIFLMSHAESWDMTRAQVDRAVPEGRDAVDAALRRLEQFGYLRRARVRGSDGVLTWFWDYTFDPVDYPIPPLKVDLHHTRKTRAWPHQGR